jgi:aryl-alcohol dehydrogenase-like predicted oxidoreductase
MRRIRFGRTNEEVSAVSFGTWAHGGPNVNEGESVGWTGHDDGQAKAALRRAFEGGITHWDTADVYGNGHSEELIGSMWGEIPRDRVFVATKVGWWKGGYDHFYDPKLVEAQLDKSLRNLRTDVIDLYYLHHCNFGEGDRNLDSTLAIVRRAQQEGKIRYIGLSDWNSHAIMRLIERVDPDVVQPYHNVTDTKYAASGLEACVEANDLGVAFFSPLKHGLLLGKYEGVAEFEEGDFRKNIPQFRDPEFLARMRENRDLMTERFKGHPEPVMHGVVDALLTGAPTATVLLGMRNLRQAEAGTKLGQPLSVEDARFVRSLFR